MPRDPARHLLDMLESARRIQPYAGLVDVEQYLRDPMLRDAVERRFNILGQALTRLREDALTLHARIKPARRIRNFRNLIVD
jgi:uncharacterized protein with HEPN domain